MLTAADLVRQHPHDSVGPTVDNGICPIPGMKRTRTSPRKLHPTHGRRRTQSPDIEFMQEHSVVWRYVAH